MSDHINLLRRVGDMDVAPAFDGYTHVLIHTEIKEPVLDEEGEETGEEVEIVYEAVSAGGDTGRTLELTCPWATQDMANAILERINPTDGLAFRYQPYSARDAILDPAAELGDAVTIKDVYSGIYSQEERFGVRHLSDIDAPSDEEVDHEYPYESRSDRLTERRFAVERAERKAEIKVLADSIVNQVQATYDNETHTFGWRLTPEQFMVYSGSENTPVLKVTTGGLTVKGKIQADTGYIGGANGFTITSGKLYSSKHSSLDDTKSDGVYIGTNGISLGKGKFKVTSSGALTASSGTFSGYVYAGSIRYGTEGGVNRGYLSGSGLSEGSVAKSKTVTAVQNNLSHGESAYSTANALATYYTIYSSHARVGYIDVGSLYLMHNGMYKHVMVDSNNHLYLYDGYD